MTVNIGGDDTTSATIDGEAITEITIDGTVAWQSGPNVTVIDDFEDGNIDGYTGYLAYFNAQTSVAGHGSYGLHGFRDGWTVHLVALEEDAALPYYPKPGDTFRTMMRTNAGNGVRFAFGKTSAGASYGDQYEISVDTNPARVYLYRRDGTSPTALAVDTSVTPQPDTWYDAEVNWGATGDISVTFYNPDGSVFSALGPVNDTTHTGGGIMYTISTEGWHDYTRKIN